MKRSVQIVSIALLGILVLLVSGALVIPSFLNWNQYRSEIEQVAGNATGRDVQVTGDISLTLLPTPAMEARDVTVANIPGGSQPEMARLERLDVRVALWPLLAGKVKIEKIVLVNPVILLERLESGQGNWQSAEDHVGNTTAQSTSFGDIRLDKFLVEGGQLTFINHQTGDERRLGNLSMLVSAESLQGPFRASGNMHMENVPVGFELSVGEMKTGAKTPASLSLNFSQSRSSMRVNGFLSHDDLVFLEGKLDGQGDNFVGLLNSIGIMSGVDSLMQLDGTPGSFSIETAIAASAETLKLDDLDFRVGDTKGNGRIAVVLGEATRVDAMLSLNSLALDTFLVADDKAQGEPMDVEALAQYLAFDIPATFSGKLDLTVNAAKYRDGLVRQLVLRASAAEGKVVLERFSALAPGGSDYVLVGELTSKEGKSRFDGHLKGTSTSLRALFDWLDITPENIPADRLANFAVESTVSLTPELLQIYGITAKLDTTEIRGGFVYALRNRPSVSVDLGIDRLDIDAYLAPGTGDDDLSAGGGSFAEQLATLGDFDANILLKLDQFIYNKGRGTGGELDARLVGGVLFLNKLRIEDYAGARLDVDGKISGLGEKPSLSLNYGAAANDLTRFARYMAFDLPARGERLGRFEAKGKVGGTLAIMDVSNSFRLGATAGTISGTIKTDDMRGKLGLKSYGLTVDIGNPSLSALINQFDMALAAPAAKDDRAARVSGLIMGNMTALDMNLTAELAGGSVKIDGEAIGMDSDPSCNLKIAATSPDTVAFVRGLGADYQPSDRQLGALAFNASVNGSAKRIAFQNMSGNFGPMSFSGSATLDRSGKIPKLVGTATAGDIPLDRLMSGSDGGLSKGTEGTDPRKRWSKEPIDPSPLKKMDAEIAVSATSLTTQEYRFQSPKFALVLEGGNLGIRDLTGKLFGGDVAITAAFSGSEKIPALALDVSISNASLEQALKQMAGINPATTSFSLKGSFKAAGKSQFDMISSLSGGATLTTSPGIVHGINLPKLSRNISDAKGLDGFIKAMGSALSGGDTAFKAFDAKIAADKGVIRLADTRVNLDAGLAQLAATVNLPQWRIDSGGKMMLSDHPKAPPIGVNVAGLVDNPKISYDTRPLQKFVGAELARLLLQNAVGQGGGLDQLLNGGSNSAVKTEPDDATAPDDGEVAKPDTAPEKKKLDPARLLLEQLLKPKGSE